MGVEPVSMNLENPYAIGGSTGSEDVSRLRHPMLGKWAAVVRKKRSGKQCLLQEKEQGRKTRRHSKKIEIGAILRFCGLRLRQCSPPTMRVYVRLGFGRGELL